jgi:hypothetical protein
MVFGMRSSGSCPELHAESAVRDANASERSDPSASSTGSAIINRNVVERSRRALDLAAGPAQFQVTLRTAPG